MAAIQNLRKLFAKTARDPVRPLEASAANELIEVGDFRINVMQRSATLQGEELGLTLAEFDVLVFLTTHPQRCVTPHTVLATSWTSDGLYQTEFLKALLSLRRKLDAVAAGKQYLRTEPWVIYRFDPRSSFAT